MIEQNIVEVAAVREGLEAQSGGAGAETEHGGQFPWLRSGQIQLATFLEGHEDRVTGAAMIEITAHGDEHDKPWHKGKAADCIQKSGLRVARKRGAEEVFELVEDQAETDFGEVARRAA